MIIKNKLYSLFIMTVFGVGAFLSSCSDNEDPSASLPKLEMSQTSIEPVAIQYTDVLNATGSYMYNYTVKLDKPVSSPILCDVAANDSLVDVYNAEHKTSYKTMPSSVYSLQGKDIVIRSGEQESNTVGVNFKSLYGLNAGENYLLPIVATPDPNCTDKINSKNLTVFYLTLSIDHQLDYIVGLNMSKYSTSMYTTLNFPNNEVVPIDGNTHTYEMLIYPYSWHSGTNYIGTWRGLDLNNSNEAFSGCEFRTTGVTGISTTGNRQCDLTTSSNGIVIPTKQWVLLTVTCDGSKTGQKSEVAYNYYINGELVASKAPTKRYGSTSSQKFLVGYSMTGVQFSYASSSYYFDGLISEIRMWKKCLTQNEIKANLREVKSPSTTDMYGYWKINEASGNVLKDYSGNGRNLSFPASSTIIWSAELNNLPDNNQ